MKNEIVELSKQIEDQHNTVEELVSDIEPVRTSGKVAETLMLLEQKLELITVNTGVND